MVKTLLKKQMLESFSWLFYNAKSGKLRKGIGLLGNILLYVAVFGIVAAMFFVMALDLCEPLVAIGYGWLYFAIIGMVAIVLGAFGSVFNTHSTLYLAKDNDLLLALPIPVSKILFARISGVYLMGLMYELIAMVPALIIWFIYADLTVLGVIFSLLIPFVLSVFVLTLSCVLGWVVALVSSKIKNKSFITVILSLAFIAAYYFFYMRAYEMLMSIVTNAEAVGNSVKNVLALFYQMGLAAEGSISSMMLFTGIILALFAVVYIVLSRTFIKIATTNKGSSGPKKKISVGKEAKVSSIDKALLFKERKRFTSSANYMMNCALGTVFILAAAVALFIAGDKLSEPMNQLFGEKEGFLLLIATAAAATMSCMNDITAPSVSLEGKSLWLLQSLPVDPWKVLWAKVRLHWYITSIPSIVLTLACEYVFEFDALEWFVMFAVVMIFIMFMAEFGLIMNLLKPNLEWTNEVIPVKQGLAVFVAMFGGMILVGVFAIAYVLLDEILSPVMFLIAVAVVMFVAVAVSEWWLRTKGRKIFAEL